MTVLRTTALLRRLYIKALCRASCRALCRALCRASAELRAEPPYAELGTELGAEPPYTELRAEPPQSFVQISLIPQSSYKLYIYNMRIIRVPTKTLSKLEALFIYRFCKGLDNRTKYISSLYKLKRRISLGLFNEKSLKAPKALVSYIRNIRKSCNRNLGDYIGL